MPGVIAGALFAFAVSFDQFVVSYFLSTPGAATLPVEIYAAIRKGFTPEINAVSTIIIVVSMGADAARGALLQVRGREIMADVQVETSARYVSARTRRSTTSPSTFADGGFYALLGPSGQRQDHAAAHDRRLRSFPTAGASASVASSVERVPVEKRAHRHGVPELCAVSPS